MLAVKDQMITMATEHGGKVKGSGFMVYETTRKGSVDYKGIPALKGVDLNQFRKPDTTVWTVKAVS